MRQVRSSLLGLMLAVVVLVLAIPARGAVGAWTPLGPVGGAVLAVAVDPQQPNFVYVSLSIGGMYRSDDGGVTWAKLPVSFIVPGAFNTAPIDLVVDPNDSMRVLALRINEIWQSLDRGLTWSLLTDSGEITQWLRDLRYDPSNPQRLYGNHGDQGLFRSDDDGATWVLTGLSGVYSRFRWVVAADGSLYACDDGTVGVEKSVNHSMNWTQANTGFPSLPSTAALAADPANAQRLYAATNLGFYVTTDAGANWAPSGAGLPASVLQLLVDPSTPATIYAVAGSNLYRSTDSGANFSLLAAGFAPVPVHLLADALAPGRLLAATPAGGVWRSTDSGATWAKTGQGMNATRISSIAIDPSDSAKMYGATDGDGLYLTVDGGTTWTRPTSAAFTPQQRLDMVAVDPNSPQRVYVGTPNISPGFFVSADNGQTWSNITSAMGWPAGAATTLAFHPTDPMKIFAAHRFAGAFKSTDGGSTWASIWAGPPAPSPSNRFGPLALDPLAPDRLYLGYADTSGSGNGRIFRTGDGGGFWGEPLPSFNPGGGILALEVDPSFVGTLYTIGGGKVYRSDTLALSWVERTTGLPVSVGPSRLVIDRQASANVYLGTKDGVWASSDRALHWSRLGNELAGQPVVALVIDPSDSNHLVASVDGGGLWEITVPNIFTDGFETGDTSAWSAAVP